ncbi:hypothetical protein JOM56_014857 [Amanita muscaria]
MPPDRTTSVRNQTNSCKAEQPQPRTRRGGDCRAELVGITQMKQISATNREEYGKSKCTRQQYCRYVERGKEFLAKCVQNRRENLEQAEKDDGVDTELLAKAFEKPPNKLSTCALEWFLVHKCLIEECRQSTAMSIYSAFTWYWDNMDGERYAGQYIYDEERGEVRGCPARAPMIRGLLKTMKARCAQDVRNQAEPMTVPDMTQIIRWSEQVVPSDLLDLQMKQHKDQFLVSKHAFMRAFITTAFTLWARCGDLCALRASHVSEDHSQPPYNLPYFEVGLVNRHTYKIFKQDIHAIDMYTHLRMWIKHLECRIGRKLQEGDYIFPSISANSHIHPIEPISHDKAQSLLTEFTTGAGITKHFKTHSFRRGGAQYRFMHAPLGKRWTLDMIQWWGGWASGEQTDVLIRYLVNSLHAHENDYSDALDPFRVELNKSLMAEHQLTGLATNDELRALGTAILAAIETSQHVHISMPTHPTGSAASRRSSAAALTPMVRPAPVLAQHTAGERPTTQEDNALARMELQPQGFYISSLGPCNALKDLLVLMITQCSKSLHARRTLNQLMIV